MLILGLLGMYFDTAVVFVTNSSLFSDWLWPYCDLRHLFIYVTLSRNKQTKKQTLILSSEHFGVFSLNVGVDKLAPGPLIRNSALELVSNIGRKRKTGFRFKPGYCMSIYYVHVQFTDKNHL